MAKGEQDLVEVLVPRHLLLDVYRFVAENGVNGISDKKSSAETSREGLPDDWSVSLVRRMYAESATHMRAILDALAQRAGEVVPANDLIEVLSKSRGTQADSSVLGGTLGAFGRRVSNRYGREQWPFSARWDSDAEQVMYSMSPGVAAIIQGK